MKRSDTSPYPVAALTHPGMAGKNNEDRFSISAFVQENRARTPVLLAVLADGIGGHRAGEVAAEVAVETLSRVVAESEGEKPQDVLHAAVLEASQSILAASQGQEDRQGMGSTLACAWLTGNRLFTVTVGDSRIYLMHKSKIRQLSIDHTWVQEALEFGVLQPEDAKNHPNAHVIRRYLGSVKPVLPDFRLRLDDRESDDEAQANQGIGLLPGDRLILCSDGLTDLVEAEEIAAAFAGRSQAEALQNLVDLANERGGHDNITILAVEIPAVVVPRRPRGRWLLWLVAFLIVLAALAALVFYGLNQLGVSPLPEFVTRTPTLTLEQDLLRTPPTEFAPAGLPTQPPTELPVLPGITPTAQGSAYPPPGAATYTPWPTNTHTP